MCSAVRATRAPSALLCPLPLIPPLPLTFPPPAHRPPLLSYAATLATHNRFQLLQRIARDGLRPEVPPFAPAPLATLMAECWAEAEHSRPPSGELVRRLRLFYYTEFGNEWHLSTRSLWQENDPYEHGGFGQQSTAAVRGLARGLARRESFPR